MAIQAAGNGYQSNEFECKRNLQTQSSKEGPFKAPQQTTLCIQKEQSPDHAESKRSK
jgi:hypothetical protein